MDSSQIINEVNDIFKDVMDNDKIKLDINTSAKDIEEWDSLSHIQLVVAMEKHFHIRFTTTEMQNWHNIGELVKCIENKVNN